MDTSRLKRLAAELRQQETIQKSLQTARHRQRCLLPTVPKVPGFEFSAFYSPCANVSGDFYDFISVSEQLIGVALGDVSGHGIEAGIIMGLGKKALQIYARDPARRESPLRVLTLLNEDLAKDFDNQTFVSASYGVLNTAQRTFRFCRAGHTPLYLVNRARSQICEEIKPKGMVIGVDKTGKHFPLVTEERVIQLQSGDLLFQYTDGVVEAPAKDNEEFGEKRLLELLMQDWHNGLSTLLAHIEDAVQKHIQGVEQADDVTMIAIKVQ